MRLAALVAVVAVAGCFDDQATRDMAKTFQSSGGRPDEPPVVLNKEQPFRYPAALYARKVQGNVTLHLYIDRDGAVHPESTRVEESSGFPSLDSAAITGSQELRFVPAKLRGEAVPVSILFPVWFRHPEAPPLPGDTVLGGTSSGGAAPRPTP
jgi:TonB family protein